MKSRSVRNLFDGLKLREKSTTTLLEKTRQNNDTKRELVETFWQLKWMYTLRNSKTFLHHYFVLSFQLFSLMVSNTSFYLAQEVLIRDVATDTKVWTDNGTDI